eukprot:5750728-Pyramimonas_sp.AAC.1
MKIHETGDPWGRLRSNRFEPVFSPILVRPQFFWLEVLLKLRFRTSVHDQTSRVLHMPRQTP